MWLVDAPTSVEMKAALQTPTFREQVKKYIQQVIKADIDGLDTEAVRAIKETREVSYARPPDPQSPDFVDLQASRERALARTLQFHKCDHHRCLQLKGNRLVCKRRAPFSLSPEAWIGPDGAWGPRRLCVYLNNWNSLLLICLSCNHDIKLLTNGIETKAVTWYITTYATKKQTGNSNISAVLARRLAYHKEQEKFRPSESIMLANKRLLQRCANTLSSLQQFSAPEAVSYLMGWGDRFESHNYVTIFWDAAVTALKHAYPELRRRNYLQVVSDHMNYPDDDKLSTLNDATDSTQDDASRLEFQDGVLTLRDQLRDYSWRGDELGYMSFLDFMLDTYEGDLLTPHQNASAERFISSKTAGRPPNRRIPYKDQAKKKGRCRIIRSPGHETLPNFVGPWFPRSDDQAVREFYCASMLLLLRPWSTLASLRASGQSFESTFDAFVQEAPRQVVRIMENIQYYHEAMSSASRSSQSDDLPNAINAHDPDETSPPDDPLPFPTGVEAEISPESITENDIEAARSQREPVRELLYGYQVIDNALQHGIFTEDSVHTVLREVAPVASRDSLTTFKEWQRILQDHTRSVPLANLPPPSRSTPTSVIMSNNQPEAPSPLPFSLPETSSVLYTGNTASPDAEASLRRRIDSRRLEGLNKDQRRAYTIIEQQLIDHLLERNPKQLLMLVVGQGGTGKSHLIETITKTFEELNASHLLAKTASTGIAATLIGGQTMHAWAGIPVRSPKKDDWVDSSSRQTIRNRKQNIEGRRILLHDEISMTTKEHLACLSECTSQVHVGSANHHASKPFGGMDVVMFGDFHQFPPVGNPTGALYCNRDAANKKRSILGHELYKQFQTVVILSEQRRVKDPTWHSILQRLRVGECTSQDLEEVRKLIVGRPGGSPLPNLDEEPWSDAVLVTARHTARQMWNSAALARHSASTGHRVYISKAEDTHGPTGNSLNNLQRLQIARLKTSQTGKLQDRVELAVGMKAMVIMNIATEADVSNGTRGKIVGIVLDPRDGKASSSIEPQVLLQYPPALVLFEPDEKTDLQFPNLPKGIIPISPAEATFSIDHGGSNYPIRRRQLALTPGYAFTDYKSQGQTIAALFVDLAKPPSGKLTPFNAYVALSRGRGRETIRLIRDFDDSLFTVHPSEDLRAEDARLEQMDSSTRNQMSSCI